jgi:glyoxylase-like metal-dependent hydrolase (beta-lactamase superfamily II)
MRWQRGGVVLTQVAQGVLVHQSEFLQTNSIVVQGRAGVLLVDAGLQEHELKCLAADLAAMGQPVVVGFSTHPDWDHLLWHADLGAAPRYGTARCVAAVQDQLSDPGITARIKDHLLETGIAEQVPLDLYGLITALPTEAASRPAETGTTADTATADTATADTAAADTAAAAGTGTAAEAGTGWIAWDGPRVRVVEHQAHAPGHAALVVEECRVLVAGDMLSDVLVPMLDLDGTADPIGDYLTALRLLDDVAGEVDVVVPGHGSVGGADDLRVRIERDRAYVLALRAAEEPSDPRIGASAKPGWEWVSDVHSGQARRLAARMR